MLDSLHFCWFLPFTFRIFRIFGSFVTKVYNFTIETDVTLIPTSTKVRWEGQIFNLKTQLEANQEEAIQQACGVDDAVNHMWAINRNTRPQ